jgi:hypothetical protein
MCNQRSQCGEKIDCDLGSVGGYERGLIKYEIIDRVSTLSTSRIWEGCGRDVS